VSHEVVLSLQPNVLSFGWSLLVECKDSKKLMDIAYSQSHGQLVVSPEDMRSLTAEEIKAIEDLEMRMIEHMRDCENNRSLLNIKLCSK